MTGSIVDRVKASQKLGEVGTSGNSTEPHAPVRCPDPLQCAGLPVAFDDVEIPISESPRQVQTGDLQETLAPGTAPPPR